MYLFDKKDNNVLVYDLKPDLEAIENYRASEMRNIPFEELVYHATTNGEPLLETKNIIKLSELNFNDGEEYHKFELDTYKSAIKISLLLSNYIKGDYVDSRVVSLLNDENEAIKYLLVPFAYKARYYPSFNRKSLEDILSIPKSLYLLQMLQQGHFNALKDEDITKQLALFNLSEEPINIFGPADFSDTKKNRAMIASSNMILQRKKKLIEESK